METEPKETTPQNTRVDEPPSGTSSGATDTPPAATASNAVSESDTHADIPADILAVPRPEDTEIEDLGEHANPRYAVRRHPKTVARGDSTFVRRGSLQGFIVEGIYVPRTHVRTRADNCLPYALPALCHRACSTLRGDLAACFDQVAETVLAVASVRATTPGIGWEELHGAVTGTWTCVFNPGADCGGLGLARMLLALGGDAGALSSFFNRRFDHLPERTALFESVVALPSCASAWPGQLGGAPAAALPETDHRTLVLGLLRGEPVSMVLPPVTDGEKETPGSAASRHAKPAGFTPLPFADRENATPVEVAESENARILFSDSFGTPLVATQLRDADGSLLYAYEVRTDAGEETIPPFAVPGLNAPLLLNMGPGDVYLTPSAAHSLHVETALFGVFARSMRPLPAPLFERFAELAREEKGRNAPVKAMAERAVAFLDFLSSLVAVRVFRLCQKTGLLAGKRYELVLEDLRRVRRDRDAPPFLAPGRTDRSWKVDSKEDLEPLMRLGLCSRKRGAQPLSEMSPEVPGAAPVKRQRAPRSDKGVPRGPRTLPPDFVGPPPPRKRRGRPPRPKIAPENFVGPVKPKGRRGRPRTSGSSAASTQVRRGPHLRISKHIPEGLVGPYVTPAQRRVLAKAHFEATFVGPRLPGGLTTRQPETPEDGSAPRRRGRPRGSTRNRHDPATFVGPRRPRGRPKRQS